MLRRLQIENYGLIERAEIAFSEGATIFTGETGSGKTMVLGALGFALGARTGADAVRKGASKAVVTLYFDPGPALFARLNDDGFELDRGEEATIAREITQGAKSVVRVNGRPSTAGYLREIGNFIAEIAGQHEAQRLLSCAYHLDVLDRFGGGAAIRARAGVATGYERATAAARELAAYEGDERKAKERHEEARFTLHEIEATAPHVDEDDRLTQRRRYLDNIERIAIALRAAHEALAGEETSATSSLGVAGAALGSIAEIGDDLREMSQQAAALQSEVSELGTRVARELDTTEFDSAELESINARLDALDRLKRKYGPSIADVLEHQRRAREIVESYEDRDQRLARAKMALEDARVELSLLADVLTATRTKAASELTSSVVAELADLALASARFTVAFESRDEIGPDGAEQAEFAFAANPGEPLRPLAKVASGGELSRVLLALVVALANVRERSALVFDEIDAGVGGTTAIAVGARIGRLAQREQVICVTHLAQLATWSDRHYVLEKIESNATTTITIREIEGEESRAFELARMLSGESHEIALQHARTMLRARLGTT